MPRYNYSVSVSRQKQFIRRFKKFLLIAIAIGLVIGLIVYLDVNKQNNVKNDQKGTALVTTIKPSTIDFKTVYFSFTAANNWINSASETSDKAFVYRSYRGALVEQELKIYVNDGSEDLAATRALPIEIDGSGHIISGTVTEHCSSAGVNKMAGPIQLVTIGGTRMLCKIDDTNFLVVVGEIKGSTSIKLSRPDGTLATYSFLYRSSTLPANTRDLVDILKSFKTL